jgi:uncharacterized protein YfaS (alpha-2-macroglobulin family)
MEKKKPNRRINLYWSIGGSAIIFLLGTITLICILRNLQTENKDWQIIPIGEISDFQNPIAIINERGASMQTDLPDQSIHLSEGKSQIQIIQPVQLIQGTPLSQAEIEQIISRLPALPIEPQNITDFKLVQGPIPPPRTGDTINETFPPSSEPIQPDQEPGGPLQVLRFSPEGEISIAPFVSITFNQAMVALTTHEALSYSQVPVKIYPELPGKWKWIGTKALTFKHDSTLIDRMPKATNYTVTVPAGTKSLSGGVLSKEVSWTFNTPPVQVITTYPSNVAQPVDPVFFIAFDQRIDREAILNKIRIIVNGNTLALKLLSQEEAEQDENVNNLIKNSLEDRWVAFQAIDLLPKDNQVNVIIGPGIPSAEGPRLNDQSSTYSFRTYAPLKIVENGCSWSQETCPPLVPFYIRFNNPIDLSSYKDAFLHIQPELPGVTVNFYDETLNIQGASQGQTTYNIEVSGDIQDIFGQKLEKTTSLTFRTGSAEPLLRGPDQNFITLDPSVKKPVFSVYSINYPQLEVQIYSVKPSDWLSFKMVGYSYSQDFQRYQFPGIEVFEGTIPVESAADQLTEVNIDLSKYLDGDFGHFIIFVTPPENMLKRKEDRYWQRVITWVQITQIGLDAFVDQTDIVAWTTSLKDGAPLGGVQISDSLDWLNVATGDDGTVRFPISVGSSYLIATKGKDQALLPRSSSYWDDSSWNKMYQTTDELRWYVFDDRGMYRPGEEVHIKGWLRRIGAGKNGDVSLVGNSVKHVSYRLTDVQGNELGSGSKQVSPLGGFDFSFKLPEKMNLGNTRLELTAVNSIELSGTQNYHSFQVQEFRRPEFEVKARNESTSPYFAGESAIIAVDAKYYAGDPLPNAEVRWTVNSSPGQYSPPNWSEFTFGFWEPWWYYRTRENYRTNYDYTQYQGVTDASGSHFLKLDFPIQINPRPSSIYAQATVLDVNRQAWTGSTTLLVHPASLYIGMKSERYFVEKNTPFRIDLIVTDLDGTPISDRSITVKAARLEWTNRNGQWQEQEADIQECTVGSQIKPVQCQFTTPLGGEYRITASVTDTQGRLNQSQFTCWVSGGQQPPSRKVELEEITIIPDHDSYQPGDSAEILVQSPFSPAEGLLTISRNGILDTQRFSIQDGSTTLRIPILETYIPNLNIQVDLVGSAPRTDDQGEEIQGLPHRPAYASGFINLPIPPLARKLSLDLKIEDDELEPGGETNLNLLLKDNQGHPVPGAEIAVVVVDEAILALSEYQLIDPLSVFYMNRSSDVESFYTRNHVILVNPQILAQGMGERVVEEESVIVEKMMSLTATPAPAMAPATGSPDREANEQGISHPILLRADFNPLALFNPSVITDDQGYAQVHIKVPDNLTRYRVMVIAVDESKKFGKAEATIIARLPIMVRQSVPRFLNFSDQVEIPVVVQNQTSTPLIVEVIIRASNLNLTGITGVRVQIPAHDRLEVRFPATTLSAGTARLQIAAVSGNYADAADISFPVYMPATTEAIATYGVIDQGSVNQPVASPEGVFPQYGGLEIQTSSTAVQALTDAVLYLVSYPFECSEQLASRILAVASLRDVLTAFKADGLPSSEEMINVVQRDIGRLQGMQNSDGGFPYWRKWQDSIPFNSIHVANALQRAEMKGFSVPQEMKIQVLNYLQQIESHYPQYYSTNTRWVLSAYALNVRSLMGDRDVDKAIKLIKEAGINLPLEAIGWLWPVISVDQQASQELAAIRTLVNNRIVETADAANFTTSYDEQTYLLLSSDRRTDAVLLEAMIIDQPDSDLIPKIVNGLLAHRVKGRWANTQENVFVLLALDRYFNTYEAQTPDFVAQIWLGDGYAGEHLYQGYTTERHETVIPMSYLVDQIPAGQTEDLLLFKEGSGRMYYRLGLSYVPTKLQLEPLFMGFEVQRTYEAVDDPDDVVQVEDGSWFIKAGARVRVKIIMVADDRRYHVALADPLPAGLEIINPELAVTEVLSDQGIQLPYSWWWWNWFEHQNLRDERAEAFTSLLWEGVYEYSYLARATTPGTFIVPPAKAEEMYSPEVFGRSGSDIVIIK